jgi:hypothetical protein
MKYVVISGGVLSGIGKGNQIYLHLFKIRRGKSFLIEFQVLSLAVLECFWKRLVSGFDNECRKPDYFLTYSYFLGNLHQNWSIYQHWCWNYVTIWTWWVYRTLSDRKIGYLRRALWRRGICSGWWWWGWLGPRKLWEVSILFSTVLMKDFFIVWNRFLDATLNRDNNITTGKIYHDLIEKVGILLHFERFSTQCKLL